jgi:DNA primase
MMKGGSGVAGRGTGGQFLFGDFALATDRSALTRQIKEANDIVAVIGGYIQLSSTGNADTYKCVCPFHNDHRPSMQVSVRYQNFRCWSCGKQGDVITFVQEFEKIPFLEARAVLARRANIRLDEDDAEHMARMRQQEAVRWAAQQYHECLLDSPVAEAARKYVGERGILGETVRKFGLGFAPAHGDWLLNRLSQTSVPFAIFEEVGLIAKSNHGTGYYDRFKDRVMFPVRNATGQAVGFGGRVLPGSPLAERGPKYYNSAETPLFSKSELLYGLDQARQAAAAEGYLAVVEGYTDVLMAHQCGVTNVVATMGTALNNRHVQQLRRFVPKVLLVFDADEGGSTGVDRALAVFAAHNIDLQVATLPDGLDPCDLLVQRGPDSFKQALAGATDALDFKLNQLLEREAGNGIEGQRRVIDAVLGVIAVIPDDSTQTTMKRELMMNRIAHRLGVREETLRARLKEQRQDRRDSIQRVDERHEEPEPPRAAKAAPHEKELLQLLLAEPAIVAEAVDKVQPGDLSHPGLRQLLGGLYDLHKAGETPDLDALRSRIENPALERAAVDLMFSGQQSKHDRREWLRDIVKRFRGEKSKVEIEHVRNQLLTASDPGAAQDLMRQLQELTRRSDDE